MADPIHVVLLICERVIKDADDGVVSAIRIVDTFRVQTNDPRPPQDRPLGMQVYVSARFPREDSGVHVVKLYLERPDGESVLVLESEPTQKDPGAPADAMTLGFNLVARFGVFPLQMGLHALKAEIDGREVARCPFTLLAGKDEAQSTESSRQTE